MAAAAATSVLAMVLFVARVPRPWFAMPVTAPLSFDVAIAAVPDTSASATVDLVASAPRPWFAMLVTAPLSLEVAMAADGDTPAFASWPQEPVPEASDTST